MVRIRFLSGKKLLIICLILLFGCNSQKVDVLSISEEKWAETRRITIKSNKLQKEVNKRVSDLEIDENNFENFGCIGCPMYTCEIKDAKPIVEEYYGFATQGEVQGDDGAIIHEIYNELISRVPSYYLDEYNILDIYYYEDNDILIQGS